MYKLKQKTALITGSTGTLTQAIVLNLANQGVNLALQYYRNNAQVNELKKKLDLTNIKYKFYQFDLLETISPQQLAQKALADFTQIDILINAASRFCIATIEQTEDTLLNEMLTLNIAVPFKLARALADNFYHYNGAIINITDIWGIRPKANFIAYSTAKAGLIGLTKALAETFAPKTTVNAIAPGIINFPDNIDEDNRKKIISRIPVQRKGTPEEIAHAVIQIIQNRYITGQIFTIDGGRLL